MHLEIERKFIVDYYGGIPWGSGYECQEILQGYFPLFPNIRLRRKFSYWWAGYERHEKTEYEFTQKRKVGKDGNLVRQELTVAIPEWWFWFIWRFGSSMKWVSKTRYVMPTGEEINEYDAYGPLFLIMEKEFASEEEAKAYTPPYGCYGEITNLEWAKDPYIGTAKIEDILSRLPEDVKIPEEIAKNLLRRSKP